MTPTLHPHLNPVQQVAAEVVNHCLTVERAYNLKSHDSGLRDYRAMAPCRAYSDTSIKLIIADGIRCPNGRSSEYVGYDSQLWAETGRVGYARYQT